MKYKLVYYKYTDDLDDGILSYAFPPSPYIYPLFTGMKIINNYQNSLKN